MFSQGLAGSVGLLFIYLFGVQAEVWRLLSQATSGDRGPIPADSDEDINVLMDKLINRPSQSEATP